MQQEPLAPPPPLGEIRSDSHVALFLDFDGTLVEIASTHDAIEVPAPLPRALLRLASQLNGRLALVSGRSLEDLAIHIGERAIAQAGSHGAQVRLADGTPLGTEPTTLPKEVVAQLDHFATSVEGLSLETKSHGAALHYRARPDIEDHVIDTASIIAKQHNLAVKRGKCVVEMLAENTNKGNAVRALMDTAPFAESRPVFIGDDVTDEDGFVAVKEYGGFGILVGSTRPSSARYRLENPKEVHHWLGLELE